MNYLVASCGVSASCRSVSQAYIERTKVDISIQAGTHRPHNFNYNYNYNFKFMVYAAVG